MRDGAESRRERERRRRATNGDRGRRRDERRTTQGEEILPGRGCTGCNDGSRVVARGKMKFADASDNQRETESRLPSPRAQLFHPRPRVQSYLGEFQSAGKDDYRGILFRRPDQSTGRNDRASKNPRSILGRRRTGEFDRKSQSRAFLFSRERTATGARLSLQSAYGENAEPLHHRCALASLS